jgi:diketogulonate reductase-like aldo/keto reductase
MGESSRFPLPTDGLSRRVLLRGVAAASAIASLGRPGLAQGPVVTKPIPSSGEPLPVLGLGSWITFNVGEDPELREECAAVIAAFFETGGRLIDSSPMYGSSQEVIGYGLERSRRPSTLFAADKVWTSSGSGAEQIEKSRAFWKIGRFDLLQVHNLVAWEEHLPLLFAMKDKGSLRYVGITTSEGRRHAEFERIMQEHPLDFVQLTYNVVDREAESRLLPLAKERGMAVIANRPFQQGALLDQLLRYPLPGWAAEIGALNWPQFILKFIVSHPAVTVAIPATSRQDHLRENMAAAHGPLPDARMRVRMASYVEAL